MIMTTTEVLPPENGLTIPSIEIADLPQTALDSMRLAFNAFYVSAKKWEGQAAQIKVTSLEQKADMAIARQIRLDIKRTRISVEAKRKELKEESIRRGKAIDGFAAIVFDAIAPIEAHLLEQEQFAVRLEEQRKDEIRAVRRNALVTYQPEMAQQSPGFDLAAMTSEQWESYLEGARIRFEQAQEKARIEEEARQRHLAEEAAERERVRVENERLKKEAEEREAASKAERKAAADKLAKERAEAEKARKVAEAKAAKERAELEAKAKADREAREAAEAEAEALRQAQREKEIAERRAEAERERAAARARRAPDKEKLLAYVTALRSVTIPALVTPIAQDLGALWVHRFEVLVSELEKESRAL